MTAGFDTSLGSQINYARGTATRKYIYFSSASQKNDKISSQITENKLSITDN